MNTFRVLFVIMQFLISQYLYSEIINVPKDVSSVQAGIDLATDGDTIIVAEGIYFENIIISEKKVVVASHFLLDGDRDHVNKTIIDGSDNAAATATFQDITDSTAILTGFTLRGGYGNLIDNYTYYGGGVCALNAYVTLQDIIISENHAQIGGVYCSDSHINLYKVKITDNAGGGIFTSNSSLFLSASDVIYNHRTGIWINQSQILFDSLERCNIYLNKDYDIINYSEPVVSVLVDTFTVLQPGIQHYRQHEFVTFDIWNGKVEQVAADIFVSPNGNSENTGKSPQDPLASIQSALIRIHATENDPHTIYLADGLYSPTSNLEYFPLRIPAYINLSGTSMEDVIIDDESTGALVELQSYQTASDKNVLENITLKGSTVSISSTHSEIRMSNIAISESSVPDTNFLGNLIDFRGTKAQINNMNVKSISKKHHSSLMLNYSIVNMENSTFLDNAGRAIRAVEQSEIQLNNVLISGNASGLELSYSKGILEKVDIKDNHGSGISYSGNSGLELSGVNILKNEGFGLGIYSGTNVIFNPTDRCNIYLNKGRDLTCNYDLTAYIDTFTVLSPTDFHAQDLKYLNLDILHGKLKQEQADFFVDPEIGNDENAGTTPDAPVKTIYTACAKTMAYMLDPRFIFLASGTYSPKTNRECIPVRLPNYVMLSGSGADQTILDAQGTNTVVKIESGSRNKILNLTVTGGSPYGIFHAGDALDLTRLIIKENDYSGVYSITGKNLTIKKSLIERNKTELSGGGINGKGFSIDSSVIRLNSSKYSGGGIAGYNCTITNSVITMNSSGEGGGIWAYDGGFLSNTQISYNKATNNAGGAALYGMVVFDSLNRCDIYYNEAGGDGRDITFRDDSDETVVTVYLDSFTVDRPTDIYAYPIERIRFDIWHGLVNKVNVPEVSDDLNFNLGQNFPNPFNPETVIMFTLPKTEYVELNVYNILGKKVSTLVDRQLKQGNHIYVFNGKNMASGIYYYQLVTGDFREVKKMILLK